MHRALTLLVLMLALGACGSGQDQGDPPVSVDTRECGRALGDEARECYTRAFLAAVRTGENPEPGVRAIARLAGYEGGALLEDCHGIMHTVGRTYGREARVTLATLMDHLPEGNDAGCTAGFAHGLVTAVAPDLDPRHPGELTRVCASAATRYQQYSCVHGFGHAFMRVYDGRVDPALDLCRGLGVAAAPDCAQGAYHDYWFAIVGADDAELGEPKVTDPRRLCGRQPAEFVRACWYRAFIDSRPADFRLDTAADLEGLCTGLAGLQRAGCITGGVVIGPADPFEQLELCAALRAAADAESCVRGTKVQNLRDRPADARVQLVERCRSLPAAAACRRWLGKVLAVVTDGAFARRGCPRLRGPAARRDCAAGAATMHEALETFS